MTDIIAEGEAFLQTIEKDAVLAWDEFLKGVTFLTHEASVFAVWLENADPALTKQVQSLINQAEASAAQLASKSGTALQNIVALGVDAAEQRAANLVQTVTGNSPLGVAASALATAGLTDLGATIKNIETVGFAKAVAGLLQAAGVGKPSA